MSDNTIPQLSFSCNMPKAGSPATPNRITPDKVFLRQFFDSGKLVMPDGFELRFWGFEDETSGQKLPSPLTRVMEGDVVHVTLKPGKRVHTIHHHGIEPEPVNDGVGHTSFEVTGSYTYQWQVDRADPSKFDTGGAGTYFYHCHVNTVLHVQMGMFGPLIVDPRPVPTDPQGMRRAFVDGPLYDVNLERIIAAFPIDPRWHDLNHAAGLCDLSDAHQVRLNDFNPKYFMLNNSPQPLGANATIDADNIAIKSAKRGRPILIRFINGGYFPQRISFDGLETLLIASDGRAFRDATGAPRSVRLRPDAGGERAFVTGAAERYDCLLNTPDNPADPGTYLLKVEFLHWIDPQPVVGKAQTTITIVP